MMTVDDETSAPSMPKASISIISDLFSPKIAGPVSKQRAFQPGVFEGLSYQLSTRSYDRGRKLAQALQSGVTSLLGICYSSQRYWKL
jgi:hypothetical protein